METILKDSGQGLRFGSRLLVVIGFLFLFLSPRFSLGGLIDSQSSSAPVQGAPEVSSAEFRNFSLEILKFFQAEILRREPLSEITPKEKDNFVSRLRAILLDFSEIYQNMSKDESLLLLARHSDRILDTNSSLSPRGINESDNIDLRVAKGMAIALIFEGLPFNTASVQWEDRKKFSDQLPYYLSHWSEYFKLIRSFNFETLLTQQLKGSLRKNAIYILFYQPISILVMATWYESAPALLTSLEEKIQDGRNFLKSILNGWPELTSSIYLTEVPGLELLKDRNWLDGSLWLTIDVGVSRKKIVLIPIDEDLTPEKLLDSFFKAPIDLSFLKIQGRLKGGRSRAAYRMRCETGACRDLVLKVDLDDSCGREQTGIERRVLKSMGTNSLVTPAMNSSDLFCTSPSGCRRPSVRCDSEDEGYSSLGDESELEGSENESSTESKEATPKRNRRIKPNLSVQIPKASAKPLNRGEIPVNHVIMEFIEGFLLSDIHTLENGGPSSDIVFETVSKDLRQMIREDGGLAQTKAYLTRQYAWTMGYVFGKTFSSRSGKGWLMVDSHWDNFIYQPDQDRVYAIDLGGSARRRLDDCLTGLFENEYLDLDKVSDGAKSASQYLESFIRGILKGLQDNEGFALDDRLQRHWRDQMDTFREALLTKKRGGIWNNPSVKTIITHYQDLDEEILKEAQRGLGPDSDDSESSSSGYSSASE